jgi:hypothetical protein
MKKLFLLITVSFFGCTDLKNAPELQSKKIGCLCNDGTFIPQNENILIQTTNLTAQSCLYHGGLSKYIHK